MISWLFHPQSGLFDHVGGFGTDPRPLAKESLGHVWGFRGDFRNSEEGVPSPEPLGMHRPENYFGSGLAPGPVAPGVGKAPIVLASEPGPILELLVWPELVSPEGGMAGLGVSGGAMPAPPPL